MASYNPSWLTMYDARIGVFMRRALIERGHNNLSISQDRHGRWQANLQNADRSYRVHVDLDPIFAIYHVLTSYQERAAVTSPYGPNDLFGPL